MASAILPADWWSDKPIMWVVWIRYLGSQNWHQEEKHYPTVIDAEAAVKEKLKKDRQVAEAYAYPDGYDPVVEGRKVHAHKRGT